jgi:uncharacterized protein (TIRG00374 family)
MFKLSPVAPEGAGAPPRKAGVRSAVMRLIGWAGAALFIYLIVRTGPGEILKALGRLTIPEIAVLLAMRLAYWTVRALNWRAILRYSCRERVPFLEILGARISAFAVSYLTPAGNIGGETVRVFMLDRIGRGKCLASVVVDKTVEFLAGLFTVALAVLFIVTEFALPRAQRLELAAAVVVVLLVLVFLVLKQKKGLFAWILGVLRKFRIRIPFIESRRERILATDAHISEFYRSHTGLFVAVFLSYFGQAWLWAAEIYLTFLFLGGDTPSLFKCFLIVTLGSFYTFLPVPGSMGVYELTYVSLFALLGIEMSSGMAVILLRRVIGLLWAGAGLLPLVKSRAGRSLRGAGARPGPAPGARNGSCGR